MPLIRHSAEFLEKQARREQDRINKEKAAEKRAKAIQNLKDESLELISPNDFSSYELYEQLMKMAPKGNPPQFSFTAKESKVLFELIRLTRLQTFNNGGEIDWALAAIQTKVLSNMKVAEIFENALDAQG